MADAIAKGIIDIGVKGQKSIDRVVKSTKQLNSVLKDLAKSSVTVNELNNTRLRQEMKQSPALELAMQKLRAYKKAVDDSVKGVVNGTTALANNEAGLVRQSAAFARVASNASLSKKQIALFTNAVQAQEKTEQKLRLAQIARFEAQRKLYEKPALGTEAFQDVQKLLTFTTATKSVSQLSAYKSELQKVFELVEIGGENYEKLKTRIKEVTQQMQGTRGSGLSDLRKNLADAKKEQEELVVGRAGTKEWVEATVRVKKAQFEYNKELAKSRIGTALINADINGSVKALNLAKQAAKGGLGLLGGVAGAIGGAGKKALGTRLGKIGAARSIDALAKKVPVVDKAFGRLLQKIPLLGKFLNENISVNARWTAQILEGITGVTLAWNGLNQIISAAQAFTAFERQAAIAINRVARMFKEMYNVAGAMMMGLISPGQVGKNLWSQALDRPDVMAARRGPSSIERLELQQAKKKAELKNTEIRDEGRLQLISKQILEIENAITDETRQRVLLAKQYQDAMMKGPVWTQYGSPAGPGAKGAGLLSSLEGNLGDAKLRLAEKVTTEGKEYENAARSVVQLESRINAELQEREAIYRRLNQGIALTKQQQQDAAMSLAAQRETATTQSPLAVRRNERTKWKGPVSNEAWSRLQRMRSSKQQRNMRFRENLMLGAGFPMLFGGGVGSVGGGVAGAIAQKGGKGFGAQILLSALGQQIDQFVGKITALGQAFNKFTPNVDAIVAAMGVGGTAIGQQIQAYVDVASKTDALSEASRQMARIIGAEGVQGLKEWGEATTKWKNDFDRAILGIQATLARFAVWVANRFNLLDRDGGLGARTRVTTKAGTDERMNELQQKWIDIQKLPFDRESDEGVTVEGQTFKNKTEAINYILRLKQERQKILDLEEAGLLVEKTVNQITKDQLQDLTEQRQVLEDTLKGGTTHAEIEKRMRAITKEVLGDNKELTAVQEEQIANQRVKVTDAVKEEESLRKQLELWTQIKDTVATGLTNAITGLIEGTKSLGESLGSIAKSIGSMLLQSAISSYVGGINFGGAPKKVPTEAVNYFSSGGMVTRPTVGVIGEAGEDEYVIPASKMASSMQRYSAGARGEAVIPSTGSSYAGSGAGGSTTVNYSGPILNFNSEEFVPKSAVGQIIATATARGASVGESRTISSLRNSRSRRSSLGL